MSQITKQNLNVLQRLSEIYEFAKGMEAVATIDHATEEATVRLNAANAAADKSTADAAERIAAAEAQFQAEIKRINEQRLTNRDALAEQEASLAALTERVTGLTNEELEIAGRIASLKTEQARLAAILKG